MPVGMCNDGQSAAGRDPIEHFLALPNRRHQPVRTAVQDMASVGGDLVTGEQHHAPVVPLLVIAIVRQDVVVGDCQKIVAEFCVVVDNPLRPFCTVAVGGVGVEVAAPPLAVGQLPIWVIELGHLFSFV